jgi:hypothetical protein
MSDEVSPDTQAVTPGSPEHDALMAETFDKAQKVEGHTPVDETRPGWLPEKFKSPEDLAKAYEELEKKLGQGTKKEADTAEPPTTEEVKEKVEAAGIDFDALSTEFSTNGTLSDDSYKALADKGFPREIVDAYIDGQRALADNLRLSVVAEVGGEERYTEIVSWAAQNLKANEIQAFNNAVESGDVDVIKLAVSGLQSRFEAAFGTEPKLVNGDTGQKTGDAFRSTAELTAAMKDPRYKNDPAYREEVQRRLSHSNIM